MFSLSGQSALVIGCGESGIGATLLLKSLGAKVRLTDSNCSHEMLERLKSIPTDGVEIELGNHSRDFCRGVDFAVLSPGVLPHVPILQWMKEENIPVWGELDWASQYLSGKVIAITGSNGKSTTSTLLWKILTEHGFRTSLAGNIGRSLSRAIVEDLCAEMWVLEVSSFQLERVRKFRPWISLILNLSGNHLDRYPSLEAYAKAKSEIFKNQGEGDWVILNRSSERLFHPAAKTLFVNSQDVEKEGTFVQDDVIKLSLSEKCEDLLNVADIPIPGMHNLENVMFASSAAFLAGVSASTICSAVKRFSGLEHRQEIFGKWDDISWVNDSKSTSVDAIRTALEGFSKPVVWIAGGRSKGGDFSSLKPLITQKVREAHFYGEAASKLNQCFGGICPTFVHGLLKDAIEVIQRNVRAQDTVVFSPGCASFDQFKNFEERGRLFKEWVREVYQLSSVQCESGQAR